MHTLKRMHTRDDLANSTPTLVANTRKTDAGILIYTPCHGITGEHCKCAMKLET